MFTQSKISVHVAKCKDFSHGREAGSIGSGSGSEGPASTNGQRGKYNIQSLSHIIEERRAEIILPESWPTAVGYGPWIEEVWANYLSNGLKYGGKPPRLQLGGEELVNGSIRYWVKDNGSGLSPEEQGKLFQAFSRVHSDSIQGHGLGLSIVGRIVKRLGGKAGVESESGRGSLFYFTLPALDTAVQPDIPNF